MPVPQVADATRPWSVVDYSPVRTMPKINASTTLRELQAIAHTTRPVDPVISPQMVRSIQQSLRMEGYFVSAASVRATARRLAQDDARVRSS